MYTYDAANGNLRCVSCDPSGDPPSADVAASEGGRFMADDGRTFFASSDDLVTQDSDHLIDVYEFVDGRPQLISSGTTEHDTYDGNELLLPTHDLGLEAVSADGADVYFSTYDTLVPQDHNGSFIKFYDARTGGGFPPNPEQLPCTAADECHGVGSSPAPEPQIGTGASLGSSGNAKAAADRKAAQRRQKHRRARHRKHRAKGRHG
jgi:hypothetical protein